MNNDRYIAIMAGGVGSRFWPASRASKPKQFLDILGTGESLLQMTFARAKRLVPEENILIVSNASYRDQILDQLPNVQDTQLLLEPSRNNTAPCVAFTALHLQAKNPNAIFAMLPADQVILKEDEFTRCMESAMNFANTKSAIVTLGITPSRPDTGYGYIQYDKNGDAPYAVDAFKEKPDKSTAETYLRAGNYLWNAGIFVWSVSTVLQAFKNSAEDILNTLSKDLSCFNTPKEKAYIDAVYPQTRSISVDFAILEHADNIYTVPADIGWSDLGTWNSLYSYLPKNDHEDVILANNAKIDDSQGNLVRIAKDDKLVVIKGLKDYIVIDEDDVLLIYPRQEEQDIKAVRKSLDDTSFV